MPGDALRDGTGTSGVEAGPGAGVGCPLCRARWEERSASSLPYTLSETRLTPCDVQRKASSDPDNFYLIAQHKLYSVPREWAERVHPGGLSSIATHTGRDCNKDLFFHSQGAQKKWAAFAIAGVSVVPCSNPPPSCTVS